MSCRLKYLLTKKYFLPTNNGGQLCVIDVNKVQDVLQMFLGSDVAGTGLCSFSLLFNITQACVVFFHSLY